MIWPSLPFGARPRDLLDHDIGILAHFKPQAIEARVQTFLKSKIPAASDHRATGKNYHDEPTLQNPAGTASST